jgi:diphthamide synthase subunit DPH2
LKRRKKVLSTKWSLVVKVEECLAFCVLIKAEVASQYAHAAEDLARLLHTIRSDLTLIAVREIQDDAVHNDRNDSSMTCSDSESCSNTDHEDMVEEDSSSSDSDRDRDRLDDGE